ncbi:ubiquitin-conjugating enzyme E2Q-like protein 1 [Arapaima gigas]
MATLLRKIGVSRLPEKDGDDPKHHHHHQHQHQHQHHQGLCKGGSQKPSAVKPRDPAIADAPDSRNKKAEGAREPAVRCKAAAAAAAAATAAATTTTSPARALVPHRQQCALRTKRLMKELQDIQKLADSFITVELAEENLFEWTVKLHQVDQDSALWQDMKETRTEYITLSISFPENFPFSPPFMRVLAPRLENGYVLDGGAICMELLTPRGWSSAYTVEAVMRQFAASLVKGQGRICRKAGKSKKAFSRKEAEATFKSLVKTHEKYGWVSPPISDG